MKILIVGKVKSGQTKRLKEEGEKLGHEVNNCGSDDLIIRASKESFTPELPGHTLNKYDLIYFLTVGIFKWEWYLTAQYLNNKYKTAIVEQKMIDPNYKTYFTPASEFLKQFEAGINFPKTDMLLSSAGIDQIEANFKFPVIVKIGSVHRGEGVFKAESLEEVKEIINKNKQTPPFLIRDFIPNDGDIRVFVIGGKAIGALKRIPSEGEFRSNISLGATGEKFDLENNPKIAEIAEKLTSITRSEIAGVDIILDKNTKEPYVLEINRGPQFAGFEKYTGINAAEAIIKYFERVYSSTH